MEELGSQQVTVQLSEPLGEIPGWLVSMGAVRGATSREIMIKTKGSSENLNAVLKRLYAHHFTIVDLHIQKDRLEDIFLQLTGVNHG